MVFTAMVVLVKLKIVQTNLKVYLIDICFAKRHISHHIEVRCLIDYVESVMLHISNIKC